MCLQKCEFRGKASLSISHSDCVYLLLDISQASSNVQPTRLHYFITKLLMWHYSKSEGRKISKWLIYDRELVSSEVFGFSRVIEN